MVYITGDTHADFRRLFPENFTSARNMTREDTVIVCGDFGLWLNDRKDKKRLDSVEKLPFTTVWVDGNHENFDRLKSGEFEIVDFHGAKADRIRDHVFHIRRGEIMELEGKSFWCFGGARSHDIDDGVVDPRTFRDPDEFKDHVLALRMCGARFRILGQSWWPEEMPSKGEIMHGRDTLQRHGGSVDFVVTHCAPYTVQTALGFRTPDDLNIYFDEIGAWADFGRWYFGHYHKDEILYEKYRPIYTDIERIV